MNHPTLNDSLDDLLGRQGDAHDNSFADDCAAREQAEYDCEPAPRAAHRETCMKCRGTGRYGAASRHGSHCFACKGVGYLVYKSSAEERAKARASGAARKAKRAQEVAQEAARAAAEWLAGQPEVAAWFVAQGSNEFAQSLFRALNQWGRLTDNQLAAVWRSIERDAQRTKERAEQAAAAPSVDTSALRAAFDAAAARASEKGLGLRYPKITVGQVVISPAGASSRNPGALYVKDAGTYVGKIQDGKFLGTRECTPETQARVLAFIADPKGSAKAYGIETGVCCICNATLTSKWRFKGIGPVCAEKWGWS